MDSKVEDDKNYDNHNDEVKESLLEIVQTIEKKEVILIMERVKCVVSCITLQVARNVKPNTSFRKEADIITKNHIKYKVLNRCDHDVNPGKFCQSDKIVTEEHRDDINRVYWTLSFECRRQ